MLQQLPRVPRSILQVWIINSNVWQSRWNRSKEVKFPGKCNRRRTNQRTTFRYVGREIISAGSGSEKKAQIRELYSCRCFYMTSQKTIKRRGAWTAQQRMDSSQTTTTEWVQQPTRVIADPDCGFVNDRPIRRCWATGVVIRSTEWRVLQRPVIAGCCRRPLLTLVASPLQQSPANKKGHVSLNYRRVKLLADV